MTTKLLFGGALVALGALGGGKLYLDHQAQTLFDEKVAEYQQLSPGLDINAEKVTLNPFSDMVNLYDVHLKNPQGENIAIEHIAFTRIDETLTAIPKAFRYQVTGLQVPLTDIDLVDEQQRAFLTHLSNGKDAISLSFSGQSEASTEHDTIKFSSQGNVDKLGQTALSFELVGVLNALNASLKAKGKDALEQAPFMLLGQASISNITFSLSSDQLRDALLSFSTEEELTAKFGEAAQLAEHDPEQQAMLPLINTMKTAFEQNKDISFRFNIGAVINQALIVELMNDPQTLNSSTRLEERLAISSELKAI